jgi:hypothetical protein
MAESMVSPGDRELDRALFELAAHVAYPPTPDIASAVRLRLANQPAARPRPFAGLLSGVRRAWDALHPVQQRVAVALVVLVAAASTIVAASPEARTAIAERLGLRGVQIQQGPALPPPTPTLAGSAPAGAAVPGATAGPGSTPSPGAVPPSGSVPPGPVPSAGTVSPSAAAAALGSRLNLGQPMTLEQARARVAFQIQVPAALGAPDQVYLLDAPVGGQVALVYYPRPDLPQASTTGVGLLLTEFGGNVHGTGVIGKGLPPGTRLDDVQVQSSQPLIGKELPPGTRLEDTPVQTSHGYWIDGDPHTFFYLDARGQVRTETTRLAGSVLLWELGDVTLRLEARLSKDQALQLASSVR